MAKDTLDGHCETRPEEYGHHLEGSHGTDGRQLASTCSPMYPRGQGINRTEQLLK